MATNYEKLTDSELMPLVLKSDKNAHMVIFDRYHVLLFSFVLRRIDNVERAKELVSEVFNWKFLKRNWANHSGNLPTFFFEKLKIGILAYHHKVEPTKEYIAKLEEYLSKLDINVKSQHSILSTTTELIRREIAALPEPMKLEFLKMQLHAGNNFE